MAPHPQDFAGVTNFSNPENHPMFTAEKSPMKPESMDIERCRDGAVLVRVHSFDRNGRRLPDAVFTFRAGDPQYGYWEEQLLNRQARQDR
jgi:hypothetical protein